MADLTMQDVRAKFPQYSDMSDDQLASALHSKFYADVPQNQFYQKIGYTPKPSAAPDTSAGHLALGAAEHGAAAIGNVIPGILNAGADLVSRATGHGGASPVPTFGVGQAGQDFSNTAGVTLTDLLDKAGLGNAITSGVGATNEFANAHPGVANAAHMAGDVAALAGAKGLGGAAVRGTADAVSGLRSAVRGEGFEVPDEVAPEAVGLKAPKNPPLQPHQQAGNVITGSEAGLGKDVPLTPENYEAGRKDPGAVIGRVAAATRDGPMSQDELNQLDTIGGSGVPISGQGSIENIEGLRTRLKAILGANDVTGRQKVDWLQALRTKGYKNAASIDPGAQELSDAQLDAAKVLEGHIERNIPEDADVTIDQFRDARTALAKNHTAEAVTQGGNVDFAALGRIYKRNPNLLTGGLQMLGRFASENPEMTGLGNRFQESLSDVAKGVDLTKPATWLTPITGIANRLMANRQAATGVRGAQNAFPPSPASRFAPIDRTPQPPPGMSAGPMGSPPTPPGQGGGFSLEDFLSHGVEQSPPAGLSAGPMGAPPANGIPFTGSPEAVGARPVQGGAPPMARRFPDDFGNEVNPNVEPHTPPVLGQRLAGPQEGLGTDLAKVASQGVPEGTATRTAPEPKVTHEVDEDTGIHTVTSQNGETHAQESGPYLLVKRTDTAKGAQGTGEGTARMEALIQQAESRGKTLGSDVSVSPAQARVYDRLKRMGYSVVKNDSTINPTTKNLISSDPRVPVFEVSSPLGHALASSQ